MDRRERFQTVPYRVMAEELQLLSEALTISGSYQCFLWVGRES